MIKNLTISENIRVFYFQQFLIEKNTSLNCIDRVTVFAGTLQKVTCTVAYTGQVA